MYPRISFLALIASTLILCSCNKQQAPEQPQSFNRVSRQATPASVKFLHRTFKVAGYTKFPFRVPAEQVNPKLQGSFRAFVKKTEEDATSEQPSPVDVMVMTPAEFDAFAHGRGGEISYSIDASEGQSVDYALPPTLDTPADYYLVFHNSEQGASSKMVQADFTLSF